MDIFREKLVISVSELTQSIKTLLELQYRFVHIQGEISNIRTPFSGHSYFTLKDSSAQIKAVLFKGQQKYLQTPLKDGQQVICHGRISVYEPRGDYQIIVDMVEPAGSGALSQQYEQLKRRLADEGLFAASLKKSIPAYPGKIILITSPSGAAVQDFLKVCKKRRYKGDILIIPAAVQGNRAADEIVDALATADTIEGADVVVLLRGGGSLEDLWCFNEERLVRAIGSTSLPVITGIGHEIDITLSDLVADLHTHTPTAAAESLIADTEALLERIRERKHRMARSIEQEIHVSKRRVETCLRVIGDLDLILSGYSMKVDHELFRLNETMQRRLTAATARVDGHRAKLLALSPANQLAIQQERLQAARKNLISSTYTLLERKEAQFIRNVSLLESVSPLSVLKRGYAIATNENNEVITDARSVVSGSRLNINLRRGHLLCEVISALDKK